MHRYRRFGGTYCIHLSGVSWENDILTIASECELQICLFSRRTLISEFIKLLLQRSCMQELQYDCYHFLIFHTLLHWNWYIISLAWKEVKLVCRMKYYISENSTEYSGTTCNFYSIEQLNITRRDEMAHYQNNQRLLLWKCDEILGPN